MIVGDAFMSVGKKNLEILPPDWHDHLFKASKFYLDSLYKLSDREAIIVGLAHIDSSMSESLKARLCKSGSIDKWLNDESFELSFMFKAKMAHSVGIINEKTLNSCKVYDRIRNIFAHNAECDTFTSKLIEKHIRRFLDPSGDFLKELETLTNADTPEEELKRKFIMMLSMDIAVIENLAPIIKPIVPIIVDWA